MKYENDELNEDELKNIYGGLYNQELVNEKTQNNESLFRQNMIKKLKEEKERLLEEQGKKVK